MPLFNFVNDDSNKIITSGSKVKNTSVYLANAVTNSSGVATIYLTDDMTASGNALFATIYENGIVAMPVGANNYQVTGVTVSADKKSVAISLNQIASVLGLLTFNANAGAGVEVRAAVWGK